MERLKVTIVGGGPAGAAAAFWLARAGVGATLYERFPQPRHRVDADLVARDALAWLAAMGVDMAALGAQRITRLGIVTAKGKREIALRFPVMALTRRALDGALLTHASAAGARVECGKHFRPDELPALGEDGKVLLAVGREPSDGAQGPLCYGKSYYRLAPSVRSALAGCVELVLFRGGFAVLQMVEREMASLLIARTSGAAPGGDDFTRRVAEVPHLVRRLEGAVALLDRPLFLPDAPLPLSAAGQRRTPPVDALTLGDCFCGGKARAARGLGAALHSGRLAARDILLGGGRYRRAMDRDTRTPAWLLPRAAAGLATLGARHDALPGCAPFAGRPALAVLERFGLIGRRALLRAGYPTDRTRVT